MSTPNTTLAVAFFALLLSLPANGEAADSYQFAVAKGHGKVARSVRAEYETATAFCITHTQRGDFLDAAPSCHRAAEIAQRYADRVRTHSRPAAVRGINPEVRQLALAVNNVGVHAAAAGDTQSARAWFLKAIDLDPRLQQAKDNASLAGRRLEGAAR